jgi:hypothetical protein
MKLTKENLAVVKIAEKDTSYRPLGVEITPEATVATDGHVLVAVEIVKREGKVEGNPVNRVLTRQAVESIAKLVNQKHTDLDLESGPNETIASNQNGTITLNGEARTGSTFPQWKRIMPNHEDGFSIYVNPALLKKIAEVLDKTSGTFGGVHQVRMSFEKEEGENHAIRFDARTENGQHVTALLMPLRGGEIAIKDWNPKEEEKPETEEEADETVSREKLANIGLDHRGGE